MSSEQFSLCWDNFHKNMSSGMNSLLENEDLVDVTLAVQGKCLKAHKMVLSVCSPYFKELFKSNPCQHPIVFMKDVSYEALSDLLQFMYQGEVQVSQENLTTFIKTAEALQIKGLTGDGNGSTDNDVVEVPVEKRTPHVEDYKPVSLPRPKKQQPPPAPISSPSVKRQRLSASTSDTQPLPPPVTKVEPIAPPQPVPIATPESSPLHFKTEPYEQSVSLLDEPGDDTFNEDTLDETVGDDNEDYSMMESGSGEEPQAGTSTDGAGEGQDILENKWDINIILPEGDISPRTRWRKCDPTKWKRNIKKLQTLEGKTTKPIDCSKCRFKCTNKFSQDARDIICKDYWSKDFNERKNFILTKVESHPPERRRGAPGSKKLRIDAKRYFLEYNSCKLRVCREFFTRTLHICNKVIEHAFQFKGEGGLFAGNDRRGKRFPTTKQGIVMYKT